MLVARRGRLRVVAVSGADSAESGGPLLKAMERLSVAVAESGHWLRMRGDLERLPIQLQSLAQAYVDVSHCQCVDVVPLLCDPNPIDIDDENDQRDELIGVLFLEHFGRLDTTGLDERVVTIANLSAPAIRNALEYESVPFSRLSRWVRRRVATGRSGQRKLWFATAIAGALFTCLFLIPGRFRVPATGVLLPKIRRTYSRLSTVKLCSYSAAMATRSYRGQPLIQLRNRDIDVEIERLQGEYQTTQQRLLAITSARLQQARREETQSFPGQLASEEQELKQRLEGQLAQLKLLKDRRERLTICSPISGRVLTWDPRHLLADRPIARGQRMLSVANLEGPWEIELAIPDRDVGYVAQAMDKSDSSIEVAFVDPAGKKPTFLGHLRDLSRRVDLVDGGEMVNRAKVIIDRDSVSGFRPGTAVQARIDCGTRSIGFVLLHDIVNFVRSRLVL